MLYADKEALRTETAVQVIRVREREMTFYVQNLNTVSTQATLLAGFTFTFLSNLEYVYPDEGYLSAEAQKDIGINDPNPEDTGIGTWEWTTWYIQIVQLIFLLVAYSCLFINLWCAHQCVVNGILGPGLALRGPAGSVDRAVQTLMKQSALVFELFELGILTFGLSMMLYGMVFFSVVAWLPCNLLSIYLIRKTFQSISHVIQQLWLEEQEVVTGSFLKEDKGRRGTRKKPHYHLGLGVTKIGEVLESGVKQTGHRTTKKGKAAVRGARRYFRRMTNFKDGDSGWAGDSEPSARDSHVTNVAAEDEAAFLILQTQEPAAARERAAVKIQKNARRTLAKRQSHELRSSLQSDETQSPSGGAVRANEHKSQGLHPAPGQQNGPGRLHRALDKTAHVPVAAAGATKHVTMGAAGATKNAASATKNRFLKKGHAREAVEQEEVQAVSPSGASLELNDCGRPSTASATTRGAATNVSRPAKRSPPASRPPPSGAPFNEAPTPFEEAEDCISAFAVCINKALFPDVRHHTAAEEERYRQEELFSKSEKTLNTMGRNQNRWGSPPVTPTSAISEAFEQARMAHSDAAAARASSRGSAVQSDDVWFSAPDLIPAGSDGGVSPGLGNDACNVSNRARKGAPSFAASVGPHATHPHDGGDAHADPRRKTVSFQRSSYTQASAASYADERPAAPPHPHSAWKRKSSERRSILGQFLHRIPL